MDNPSTSRNQGFTLIEILTALMVISVGILSIGLMQGKALRSVTDASQRSQATWLATGILERMRANDATALTQYVSSVGYGQAAVSNPATVNSPARRAQADLYAWQQDLAGTGGRAGLLQATGTISRASNIYTITVSWLGGSKTSTTSSLENRTVLITAQF